MAKFWLIQRGTFKVKGKYLTGSDGVVSLDYMGSAEFGFSAIQKAFRRLMYHFSEYEVFNTGIYTPEKDELMVFCQKNYSTTIIQAISQYIEKPYHLKEYSELEEVPKARKEDTSYRGRHSNFWWCIDIKEPYGDWMAFLQPHCKLFTEAVRNNYQDWWLTKSPKEREEEYKKSLRW